MYEYENRKFCQEWNLSSNFARQKHLIFVQSYKDDICNIPEEGSDY